MLFLIDGLSSEIASRPSDSSPKVVDYAFSDQQQKLKVHPFSYSRSNSLLKVAVNNAQQKDSSLKLEGPRAEANTVSSGEVSRSHVEQSGEDKRISPDNRGLLPNTCLPCLSAVALSVEKRRPTSPETPSSRRKSLSKLSFKWREAYADTVVRKCLQHSL